LGFWRRAADGRRAQGTLGPYGRCQAIISQHREIPMGTVLLIILILLVVGALPNWGYSRGWGYYPSGGIGLIFLILLILILTGRVNF
jgi:hypothetical protein